ncbi:MAG: threonine synthase [Thaumarchaeota archaeon]|nr:threonine synthase [Nitrososphaerota archaeon]
MATAENKKDGYILRCFSCKTEYNVDDYGKFYRCAKCGNLLEVKRIPAAPGRFNRRRGLRPGVWKYFDLIPLWSEEKIVSLAEGGTTLFDCRNLATIFGIRSLFVKFEGLNPTGSFKDRGMTVGVSKAFELNYKSAMCASTGNTSASLAAYSAKAGMRCIVLVPKGKIAMGKMAQAIAYGAEIYQVDGNFDDSLRVASEICERDNKILLLNSLNPFRIEGQKTVSFEIVEQLGGTVPDFVVLPVGNGGNITAAWKGFSEIFEGGLEGTVGNHLGKNPPKMIAVQAQGAAPIARAFRSGLRDSIEFVSNPQTEASAINIGSPVSWMKALAAIYDSGGLADFVSDEEIFAAQKLIASKEGIFVEPASATPIAYLSKIAGEKSDAYEQMKDACVVCICTGNGLKDPNALLKGVSLERLQTISAEAKSLETVLA